MDDDVVVPAEVGTPQTNTGYEQNIIIDRQAAARRAFTYCKPFRYIRKLSTRWRRNVVGSNPIIVPAEAEAATSRNWAELPRDIGYEIFCRFPHVDVLESAGLVCASWRRIAVEEPMLWLHIDIAFDWEEYVGIPYDLDRDYFNTKETPAWLLALTRAAVDRSAGRCESFCGPVDCNLLLHLAASSPSLRSLQVTSFFRLHREFVGRVVPKLPMLERLVIPRGFITSTTLRAFIDYCPRLQLLDAGGCYIEYSVCGALFEWLLQTKVVTMPRLLLPRDELYIRTQEDEEEIGVVIGRYF